MSPSRNPTGSPTAIGDECEAYLHGAYVEYLAHRTRTVPPWVRINPLAHASRCELVALAQPSTRVSGTEANDAWDDVVAFLAEEILRAARGPEELTELQRTVLVPLELDLARKSTSRTLSPRRLLGTVVAALRGHPSWQAAPAW